MSQIRSIYVVGLILIAATSMSSPAAAASKGRPQLLLKGSNGYDIAIDGKSSTVFLTVSRPGHPPAHSGGYSTYVARGTVNPTTIRARFGSLGSVAVRFHPSGKIVVGRPVRHCRGRDRMVTRYGVFVGAVRFRGEGGYTEVHTSRAKGKVVSARSLSCDFIAALAHVHGHRGPTAKVEEGKQTVLAANVKSGVMGTYFRATTPRTGKTRFLAVSEGTEGDLGFYRVAFATASPLTFAFDNRLSFGSVTPPPPFSGSASLQRNPGGTKTWTGPLAVSFPGQPLVPLTGPLFKTQLTQNW